MNWLSVSSDLWACVYIHRSSTTTIRTSNVNVRIILKIADGSLDRFASWHPPSSRRKLCLAWILKFQHVFSGYHWARDHVVVFCRWTTLPLNPPLSLHAVFKAPSRDRGSLSRNIPPAFIIYERQPKKLGSPIGFSLSFVRRSLLIFLSAKIPNARNQRRRVTNWLRTITSDQNRVQIIRRSLFFFWTRR